MGRIQVGSLVGLVFMPCMWDQLGRDAAYLDTHEMTHRVQGAQSMLSVMLACTCDNYGLIRAVAAFTPSRWAFGVAHFMNWESQVCQPPQFTHAFI